MTIDHLDVSDDQLLTADLIYCVDPNEPLSAGHQLWGAVMSASEQEMVVKSLAVAVPLSDGFALLYLIARIEKLKGSLPPHVEVLRKNLAW